MRSDSGRLQGVMRDAWMAYLPPATILIVYYLAAQRALNEIDLVISFNLVRILLNISEIIPGLVAVIALIGLVKFTTTRNDGRGRDRLKNFIATFPLAEILFMRLIAGFIFFRLLQGLFLSYKRTIPELNPFGWDLDFAAWDRALFLGTDPWVITHSFLDSAAATKVVDVLYTGGWFSVTIIAYLIAMLLPLQNRLRLTFLVAFSLDWIIGGTIVATIFSSAGPVYVQPLFGDTTFVPLIDRLAQQHSQVTLASVLIQADLWKGYLDPAYPAMGISAFPSLHVCIATTVALFAWSLNRSAGILLSVFVAIIFVGSIHLGWHYAVDGMAGATLAILHWKTGRALANWWFLSRGRDPEPVPVTS